MATGSAVTAFYILTEDGSHFEFDATVGATLTEGNSLTKFPIQSGSVVSDHIVKSPVNINFNGVISSVKSTQFKTKESFDTVDKMISEIRRLLDEGEQLTVVLTDEVNPIPNCVITDLQLSQTENRSTFYAVSPNGEKQLQGSSWEAAISFEQLQKGSAVTGTILQVPVTDKDRKDQTGDSDNGDAATSPPRKSILYRAGAGIYDWFAGDDEEEQI